LDELANMESLWSLLGEHVKEFLGIWRLVRLTQVLVTLVQLRSDVIKSDAAISKALERTNIAYNIPNSSP
jgi:hypothetical protein